MTSGEARSIYRRMLAVWPHAKDSHDDQTVGVWLDLIGRTDFSVGRQVADRLASHSKWFPSVSEWEDTVRSVCYRKGLEAGTKAIGAGRASREVSLAAIAEARDALRGGT